MFRFPEISQSGVALKPLALGYQCQAITCILCSCISPFKPVEHWVYTLMMMMNLNLDSAKTIEKYSKVLYIKLKLMNKIKK